MRTKKRWTGGALVLAGSLVLGTPATALAAHATMGCFTPVRGIDGKNPLVDQIGDPVTDSYWSGSFGYGWQTGTLGEADFKAVVSNGDSTVPHTLFLSWTHRITTSGVKANEGVVVGFGYTPSGSSDQVSQILYVTFGHDGDPDITTPTALGADGLYHGARPGTVKLLQKIGSTDTVTWPGTAINYTQWLKNATSMYVFQAPSDPQKPGQTQLYWTVQMAIPLITAPNSLTDWSTPGVYIDKNTFDTPSLGINYWADIIAAPLDTGSGNPTAIMRSWPDPGIAGNGTPNTNTQGRDQSDYHVPSPDNWSTMEPGFTAPPQATDPKCDGTGLYFLGNADITNNGQASGLMNLTLYNSTVSPVVAGNNDVKVTVHNNSSVNYDASTISAVFSIAPYGSQTARSASWAPLNDKGNPIACTSGSGASCSGPHPVPGLTTIPSALLSGNGNSQSSFVLHTSKTWNPDASYTCAVYEEATLLPYDKRMELSSYCASQPWLPQPDPMTNQIDPVNGGIPDHQCMQVELSSSGSSGVVFANKSAFRNMHATGFTSQMMMRAAKQSPKDASPRNIVREPAYVDTSGLPRIGKTKGHYIYFYIETRNMPYSISQEIPILLKRSASPAFSEEGNGSYDAVARYAPTYIVHVYADTGMTSRFGKKKVTILTPMSSFGQFVDDSNVVNNGWNALLEGAELVGKNTYRKFINNNAVSVVTTNVEATSAPRCTGNVKGSLNDLLTALQNVIAQVDSDTASRLAPFIGCGTPISCDDLNTILADISAKDWGCWNSWVASLVSQLQKNSGCSC